MSGLIKLTGNYNVYNKKEGFYKKIIALRNELRNYFSSIYHVDSEQ